MKTVTTSVLLAGVAAASLYVGPALAQSAPAENKARAENGAPANTADSAGDIVVTAQKRSESMNNVGISITALSGAALANQNVTQASDFVKVVPGLNYTRSSYGAPVFTLRGIGFNETSLGASPTVTLYLDEVPLPFPLMTSGTMLDLQRVEVLKGPQGTLFGQNSTGGAINFIANRPTPDFRSGFTVTLGSYEDVSTEAYVSGPITETLRARVAMRKEYSGTWQQSTSRDDQLGMTDRFTGRVLIDWQPVEPLSIKFNFNGWQDRSDTQAGQFLKIINPGGAVPAILRTIPTSPERPRAADWDPNTNFRAHDNFYQTSLRMDYEFGADLVLTSISAYEKLERNNLTDTDGTQYQAFSVLNRGTAETFSQEVRLSGHAGSDVRWVVGGNYQRDRVLDRTQPLTSVASFPFPSIEARSFNRVSTFAGFGNVDWKVIPTVNIQAGVRYTKQDRAYEGCTYDTGDGRVSAIFSGLASILSGQSVVIPPGGCVTLGTNFLPAIYEANLNQGNVSWRFGLNWKPRQSMLLYANASRGYKSGTFVTSGATFAGQLYPATQESVLAYEAGFKLGLIDRTLQINGAGFYYDYHDKQIRGRVVDPNFGLQNRLINLPRSRIAGAELQLIYTPTRHFTLNLAGTYVDSKILGSFVNYTALGGHADFGGTSFPLTPKWQLTGNVQYEADLSASTRIFVGAGATYQSKTNAALGNEPLLRIKSYMLVDLRAGVRDADDRWRVSGFVRNLADAYYYSNVVLPGPDTAMRYAGRGRTYGVTLGYNYR